MPLFETRRPFAPSIAGALSLEAKSISGVVGIGASVPSFLSSLLSSFSYVKEFIKLYRENDLEYVLSVIDKNNQLYEKVIDVINKCY